MKVQRYPVPVQRALTRADLAGQVESLDGRRVVLAAVEGPRYDRRAVGEIYVEDGAVWVKVAWEVDFYAAILTGAALPTRAWPAGCVWVEEAPVDDLLRAEPGISTTRP